MHTYRRTSPTTKPRPGTRRRTSTVLLALGTAGALLLTGCGGGDADRGNSSSYDRGKGESRPEDGFPAPAPEGTGSREQREGQTDGESRDVAPTPDDFLSTFALDVDTASYGYARRTLAEGRLPDPWSVRPEEFDAANNWSEQNLSRSISSTDDLNNYLAGRYNNTFAILYHSWWVPRPTSPGSRFSFPVPRYAGTRSQVTDGWPERMEDKVAAFQPIITDYCFATGYRTEIRYAMAGHSTGGAVDSVNLVFADGHVETHPRARIQWQYWVRQNTAFY